MDRHEVTERGAEAIQHRHRRMLIVDFGDKARTATSTSWRRANSRSAELARVGPSAVAALIAVSAPSTAGSIMCDWCAGEHVITWSHQQPQYIPLRGPVLPTLPHAVAASSRAVVQDVHGTCEIIGSGAAGCGSGLVNRWIAEPMSSLTNSITVSTFIRPAMCPTKNTSVPTQTKASMISTLRARCGTNTPSLSVRTLRSTISA